MEGANLVCEWNCFDLQNRGLILTHDASHEKTQVQEGDSSHRSRGLYRVCFLNLLLKFSKKLQFVLADLK